jgi:hypothetical protein
MALKARQGAIGPTAFAHFVPPLTLFGPKHLVGRTRSRSFRFGRPQTLFGTPAPQPFDIDQLALFCTRP